MSTTATKLFCLALVGGMFQRETSVDAFSLNGRSVVPARDAVAFAPQTVLYMSEEEAPEEIVDESAEATEEEAEDEGPPEDPEVTALKESIAELEATLADKKSKIQYELERCEEYSKSGYARKVADMENMKRVRSVSRECGVMTDEKKSIVYLHSIGLRKRRGEEPDSCFLS